MGVTRSRWTAATRVGGRRGPGIRGVGRLVAMALALIVVAFLLLAGEARAGTYRVAQCGWGLGVELDPTLPVTPFLLTPGVMDVLAKVAPSHH